MSRGPARFKQSDIARAIRAAKQAGGGDVLVQKDGTIVIKMAPATGDDGQMAVAEDREIVL